MTLSVMTRQSILSKAGQQIGSPTSQHVQHGSGAGGGLSSGMSSCLRSSEPGNMQASLYNDQYRYQATRPAAPSLDGQAHLVSNVTMGSDPRNEATSHKEFYRHVALHPNDRSRPVRFSMDRTDTIAPLNPNQPQPVVNYQYPRRQTVSSVTLEEYKAKQLAVHERPQPTHYSMAVTNTITADKSNNFTSYYANEFRGGRGQRAHVDVNHSMIFGGSVVIGNQNQKESVASTSSESFSAPSPSRPPNKARGSMDITHTIAGDPKEEEALDKYLSQFRDQRSPARSAINGPTSRFQFEQPPSPARSEPGPQHQRHW